MTLKRGLIQSCTWCQAMISDKVYGDLSLLKLIASMWSVRITVVRCDTLSEVRIRHDLPLEQAEIVLLYNGVPVMGHYCAGIKGSSDNTFMKLDCKRVVRNLKYEKEVDVIERLERKDVLWDLEKDTDVMEGCKILVDKKEYDVLKKKGCTVRPDQFGVEGFKSKRPITTSGFTRTKYLSI